MRDSSRLVGSVAEMGLISGIGAGLVIGGIIEIGGVADNVFAGLGAMSYTLGGTGAALDAGGLFCPNRG